MIYSTVNHQRGGWVGPKIQKHDDVILEWSLRREEALFMINLPSFDITERAI